MVGKWEVGPGNRNGGAGADLGRPHAGRGGGVFPEAVGVSGGNPREDFGIFPASEPDAAGVGEGAGDGAEGDGGAGQRRGDGAGVLV